LRAGLSHEALLTIRLVPFKHTTYSVRANTCSVKTLLTWGLAACSCPWLATVPHSPPLMQPPLVGPMRLCQESLNPGSPAAPHRGEEMTMSHKSLSPVNQEVTS
jgi:hypothetical protein